MTLRAGDVLVRQPDGFEGLFRTVKPPEQRELVATESQDVPEVLIQLDSTPPSTTAHTEVNDDVCPCLDHPHDIDVGVVPNLKDRTEGGPCRSLPASDAGLNRIRRVVELERRVEHLDHGFNVLLDERVVERPDAPFHHPIHVLLKHRPRSIPQAQESA